MRLNDPEIQNLYDHLSKVNQIAYESDFLLCNDILAKNPGYGNLIDTYKAKSPAKKLSSIFQVIKFSDFYIKGLGMLIVYGSRILAYKLSGQKYNLKDISDDTITIDEYFIAKKINQDGHFKTSGFQGLDQVLKKMGKNFVYLPKIIASRNPYSVYKMLKIIKKNNDPVLTEYQLLKAGDFLRLLKFLIIYPFLLRRFINKLGGTYEDKALSTILWNNIRHAALSGYIRYLFGRQLAFLPASKIKCISWFENQILDKNFYKGLRGGSCEFIIYGCQLFLWAPSILNIHPDEKEAKFGVLPDIVVSNGPYYMPNNTALKWRVGPSLRYRKMFDSANILPARASKLLVVLPFWGKEIEAVIDMIGQINSPYPIMWKFHPATNHQIYRKRIAQNMEIVQGDIQEIFGKSRIIIGKSTGSLLEAACLGIPVISLDNKSKFSHNYLPELGKGIIWEEATSLAGILEVIKAFDLRLKEDPDSFTQMRNKYRELFFCKPSEEKIIETFDLR